MSSVKSKVSAIIPAYNAADTIARAIYSIIRQSVAVDEIIVVDDGSTDNTAEIAAQTLGGIKIVRQRNGGPSAARNAALRIAKNDLVAFLDSDDFWLPDKIQRQLQCLNDSDCVSGVVTGFEKRWDHKNSRTIHFPGDEELENFTPIQFVVLSRASPSTLIINRKITGDIAFPEDVVEGEDPIFFGLVRAKGVIRSVDSVLTIRTMHEAQLTQRPGSFARSLHNRREWLARNWRELKVESAAEADRLFWIAAKEDVMARFWARDFSAFNRARIELQSVWPRDCEVEFDLKRQRLPSCIYEAKDFLDLTVRRFRGM